MCYQAYPYRKPPYQQWLTLLAILWTIAVIVASLLPVKVSDERLVWAHMDKIVHFIFYFGATVLWQGAGYRSWRVFFSLFLLGWLIEYLQQLSGWRSGDVYDGLCNSLGVICAWLAAKLTMTLKRSFPIV